MVQIPMAGREHQAPHGATARIRGAACALALLAALAAVVGCASSPSGSGAPTPTPTALQRIVALARHAISSDGQHATVTAAFGSPNAGTPTPGTRPVSSGTGDTSAVTVTITLAGPVPAPQQISAEQERVKTICFQVERALWTSATPLSVVTVQVIGPIYDDFADLITGSYGAAALKAAAATKLDWASLNPDAAWAVYGTWLRPDYQPRVVGQYGG